MRMIGTTPIRRARTVAVATRSPDAFAALASSLTMRARATGGAEDIWRAEQATRCLESHFGRRPSRPASRRSSAAPATSIRRGRGGRPPARERTRRGARLRPPRRCADGAGEARRRRRRLPADGRSAPVLSVVRSRLARPLADRQSRRRDGAAAQGHRVRIAARSWRAGLGARRGCHTSSCRPGTSTLRWQRQGRRRRSARTTRSRCWPSAALCLPAGEFKRRGRSAAACRGRTSGAGDRVGPLGRAARRRRQRGGGRGRPGDRRRRRVARSAFVRALARLPRRADE